MKVLSIVHYSNFIGPHNSNMRVIPVLRKSGIETTVVLPDEPGNAAERMRAADVEVLQIPLGRVRARLDLRIQSRFIGGLWPQVRALRRLIRERQIDVVWLNAMIHPHGAIAARLEGVPTLWQLIDEVPPMILRRLMMPYVVRNAGCVMTTGMYTARAHPGASGLGERLIPFFPPVDVDRFRPNPGVRMAAREELGIKDGEILIGNVASLAPYKDHVTFVRAAADLRRTHPNTRFAILGYSFEQFSGYADSVIREAQALGLVVGRDLILRDPGVRVAELAQAFDAFWLSSISEGAPTVLCEAMALGLPVVATAIASVPEMVEHGVTGFLVPTRSPIAMAGATRQILDDRTLRVAMSAAARRTAVERFDVVKCAELHALAIEVAANRGGRPRESAAAA